MRSSWRLGACVFAAFVVVALLQAWPLPRQLSTHLTGAPAGDTGIYVWNMWVFRHELVDEGGSPFFTSRILTTGDRADLGLHNYTAFANLVALPLQPLVGLIATFNLVYLLNVTLAGVGMYLLARRITGRVGEAWLAGLLFACSPYLATRSMSHLSLVGAAPLPLFLYFVDRTWATQRRRDAIAAGGTLAWAACSDPYYAVYCLMLLAAFVASKVTVVRALPATQPDVRHLTRLVDLAIVTLGCLIVAVYVVARGTVRIGPIVISMHTLYTPMLILTLLGVTRLLLVWRPRVSLGALPPLRDLARAAAVAGVIAVLLLSPVLYAVTRRVVQGRGVTAPVMWRSSAAGVDAVSFVVPNPNHPLMPHAVADWQATRRNGYHDEVASFSWVAFAVLVLAWRFARWRPPLRWAALTLGFASLSLGPFLHVAGLNTYIPTPWALLRYLPIVGEARMPSRFAIVAMLGFAVLFASALTALATRVPHRRRTLLGFVGVLLAFELLPAPRTLYSAEIPAIYDTIAADPRDIAVLELPTGIRDGLSSLGNFNAASQFYQTRHGKRLTGGYLSRLSTARKNAYRRLPVSGALMTLSEGRPLTPNQLRRAREGADEYLRNRRVGYIVIDTSRASAELTAFAIEMFGLRWVDRSGARELYLPREPAPRRP